LQDVRAAVSEVQLAGVTVRMVTGDNKITAAAIAKECGILFAGSLVLEGPDFRCLSPRQLDELLPILAGTCDEGAPL
jgi:P-type Ca2+ transporter type 2C